MHAFFYREEAVASQIAAASQDTGPKHETVKVDENSLVPDPSSMDAAKEAYERAARDQASLPLEVRLSQFREMLIDKQVRISSHDSIFFLEQLNNSSFSFRCPHSLLGIRSCTK